MDNEIDIPEKYLMTMKILAIALLMGPMMFFFVILLLGSMVEPGDPPAESEMMTTLTAVCFGITVILNLIAPFIQKMVIENSQAKGAIITGPIAAIQTGLIVRYALGEGMALFGLVIILIGTLDGELPLYIWLNLLPFTIFVAVVISTFPTRTNVEKMIKKYL